MLKIKSFLQSQFYKVERRGYIHLFKVISLCVICGVLVISMPRSSSASRMVIFLDRSNGIGERVIDAVGDFVTRNRLLFNDIAIKIYDGKVCQSCEVVIAMGKGGEKKTLKNAFKIVNHSLLGEREGGMIHSINRVISGLKGDSDVVILLSGGEMCKSNACRDIGRLRNHKRKSAKVYAIGLSVPDIAEMEQLKCIASTTGGSYFNVSDVAGLKVALEKIEKIVSYNLEVKVFRAKGEEVTDYMRTRYGYAWWAEVYKSGKTKKVASTYTFPARFYLKQGKYDVLIHYENADKWLRGLKVGFDRRTRRRISFAKGSVVIKVYNGGEEIMGTKRVPRLFWWCEVYLAGSKEKMGFTETFPVELNLVVGKYDIKVHYMGDERVFKNVVVQEGKTVSLKAAFQREAREE